MMQLHGAGNKYFSFKQTIFCPAAAVYSAQRSCQPQPLQSCCIFTFDICKNSNILRFCSCTRKVSPFPLPPTSSLLATQTLATQTITCGLALPWSSSKTQQSKASTQWPGTTSEEGVCMPAGAETFQSERGGRGRAASHLKSNENQAGELSCAHTYMERGQILLMPNSLARGELPNTVHF